jgi:hypothetical protein
MSKRNRYREAFGVVGLRWRRGDPPPGEAVLCEVWRADLSIPSWGAGKMPRIGVAARLEARCWDGQRWRALGPSGLYDPTPGTVRRWASLGRRWWHGTLTLDGWNEETE